MSPLITKLLIGCLSGYAIIAVVELILGRFRLVKRFIFQIVTLLIVAGIFRITFGFPNTKTAFAGATALTAIVIMFACTIVGIAANYVYSRAGRFTWHSFLKPLVISPIILLPLIGSIHNAQTFEGIQLISLAFLSFQNGFFYKKVMESVADTIRK